MMIINPYIVASAVVGGSAYALLLDGSNDYMYASAADFSGLSRSRFMLVGVIEPDSLHNGYIISKHNLGTYTDNEWRIRLLSDGRMQFVCYDGADSTEGSIITPAAGDKVVAGEYNMFVCAFDYANADSAKRIRLWVRNVEQAQTDVTVPDAAIGVESGAEVVVGKIQNTSFFDGKIHQLSVLNDVDADSVIDDILATANGIQDISGITGLFSHLDVAGGVVTNDSGSAGASWTNSGCTSSTDVPT